MQQTECAQFTDVSAPRVACPSTYDCAGKCFHMDRKGGQAGPVTKWHCRHHKTSAAACSSKDVFCESEYDCSNTTDSMQQTECAQFTDVSAPRVACPSTYDCAGKCFHMDRKGGQAGPVTKWHCR